MERDRASLLEEGRRETRGREIEGETPQRQWGSFDSRANWNAADANDDGAGVGISSVERWGLRGSCKSRCNRRIGGAYISHGVVARDIEAHRSPSFFPLASWRFRSHRVALSKREPLCEMHSCFLEIRWIINSCQNEKERLRRLSSQLPFPRHNWNSTKELCNYALFMRSSKIEIRNFAPYPFS